MKNQMITLATYQTAFEAELARQHLENCGIMSFVNDQHTSSVLPPLTPAIGYVKLRCRESDAEKALELLKNASVNSDFTDEEKVNIQEGFQNTMGDDYMPVHSYCPDCESTNVYRKKFGSDINVVSALFAQLSYRIGINKVDHFCDDCRHIWKDCSEDRVSG